MPSLLPASQLLTGARPTSSTDGELSWTFRDGGLGPVAAAQIGNRPIPYEPMYIRASFSFVRQVVSCGSAVLLNLSLAVVAVFNLAISENFGAIDCATVLAAHFSQGPS